MTTEPSYPKTPYDPSVTSQLAKWRKEVKVSQTKAAAFFDLRGKRSRETIGDWENGKAKPGDEHQERFIEYLWRKLEFNTLSRQKKYQYLLVDLWDDIMVEQWGWPPLNIERLWPYVPYVLKHILRDPSQVPPELFPPKDYEPYGQDELLADLKEKLQLGQRLALYGMAAIGKTTLAVALAHDPDIRSRFPDGILWAGLGTQADEATVFGRLRSWGEHLGISQEKLSKQNNIIDLSRVILHTIGRRRILLVIDDAWDIVLANNFQVGGRNCTHLLTTRYQDIALDFANGGSTEVPPLKFNKREVLLGHLFPELNVVQLQPLIETVGGVPFSLILMGRYIRNHNLTAQDAIKVLEDTKHLLDEGRPTPPLKRTPSLEDQALITLRALIALSYDALTTPQKAVILALATFPPDPNTFSQDAALHVAKTSEQVLSNLIAHQDLVQTRGKERCTLHQTTSDFLIDLGIAEAIYQRFVEFFVDLVEKDAAKYEILEVEASNIFEALDIASINEFYPFLLRGVVAFYQFLETRGLFTKARHHLEQAVMAAELVQDEVILTTLTINQGRIAEKLGSLTESQEFLEKGLKHAQNLKNQQLIGTILMNLGNVNRDQNPTLARTYYEQALPLAQEISDPELTSKILGGLSIAYFLVGELNQAKEYNQRCLDLSQQFSDKSIFYKTKWMRGVLEERSNKDEEAEKHYLDVLIYGRTIGDTDMVSGALNNLGEVAFKRKDYAKTKEYFEQSIDVVRETGQLERIVGLLINFTGIAIKLGQYDEAAAYFQQIRDEFQDKLEHGRVIVDLLNAEGDLLLAQQNPEAAKTKFEEALDIARKQGMKEHEAKSMFGLARAEHVLGHLEIAEQLAQDSVEIFEDVRPERADQVSSWLDDLPQHNSKDDST